MRLWTANRLLQKEITCSQRIQMHQLFLHLSLRVLTDMRQSYYFLMQVCQAWYIDCHYLFEHKVESARPWWSQEVELVYEITAGNMGSTPNPRSCCMRQSEWRINASFGTHTGGTMSLGKDVVQSTSKRQRGNIRSLTEAELVCINKLLSHVLWTCILCNHKAIWHIPQSFTKTHENHISGQEWQIIKKQKLIKGIFYYRSIKIQERLR